MVAASCQLNEAQHAQQAALTGRFAGLPEEQRMAAMHEQEELRGLQEQLGSLQAREAGAGLTGLFHLQQENLSQQIWNISI